MRSYGSIRSIYVIQSPGAACFPFSARRETAPVIRYGIDFITCPGDVRGFHQSTSVRKYHGSAVRNTGWRFK